MTNLIAQTLDLTKQAVEQNLPGAGAATPEEGLGTLFEGLLSMAMTAAAILVLLYLLWGAFEWITSGGDSGKLSNARNRILQAIVGILVLGATTAIFMLVQNFLGICVIKFGGTCNAGGQTSTSKKTQEPEENGRWATRPRGNIPLE